MKPQKVLIVNYFLLLGGGEKLLMELVDFCLANHIRPEILITENRNIKDNERTEHYDPILKQKGVKVRRVPVFYKSKANLFTFIYWRFRLRYAALFYSSVHVINLNLADRLYELIGHDKRVFWHITNRIQFAGARYPYRQLLLSKPTDTIVTINKFQHPELTDYFKTLVAKIIDFKLFLNK